MRTILLFLILCISVQLFSQTLSNNRRVNWTLAGLRDTTTNNYTQIDVSQQGLIANTGQANDAALSSILASLNGGGAILYFPAGTYLFNQSIILPSNIVLKGEGAQSTTLEMDLGGTQDAIHIRGSIGQDSSSLVLEGTKDSMQFSVLDASGFAVGDWVQIIQRDDDLVTSSWAEKSVGQILNITNIQQNQLTFDSPLRMTFDLSRQPYVQKILPKKNVGIECLKVKRVDDTAPAQSSTFLFSRAINCWVKGVESENCTFAHIDISYSSNIKVAQSYLHHAFGYGGGGRAYGVVLQYTSGECLIEDNIFQNLRHSMLLQSGANGNVFAYNYSRDAYWSQTPNDAAGDMVLHGNYPYANLFEHNLGENIVIDNSHGPNGPYNTFLRNRAILYGILFTATNSPNQNLLGNEVPNSSFPYNLVNYMIRGAGHFLYGNNNKGSVVPSGTNNLGDSTYAYGQWPGFLSPMYRASIGTPNVMGQGRIPAYDRYIQGQLFGAACTSGIVTGMNTLSERSLRVYPNPFKDFIEIQLNDVVSDEVLIEMMRINGQVFLEQRYVGRKNISIETSSLPKGVYLLRVNKQQTYKLVK